jgi:hypothetical protein
LSRRAVADARFVVSRFDGTRFEWKRRNAAPPGILVILAMLSFSGKARPASS